MIHTYLDDISITAYAMCFAYLQRYKYYVFTRTRNPSLFIQSWINSLVTLRNITND